MTGLPEASVERPYGDPPVLAAKPDWKVAFSRARAKFSQDQCTDLAASLTYYSVQAMFPAIIAAVSTIGLFGNGKQTTHDIMTSIRKISGKTPPSSFTTFLDNLQGGGAGVAFIVGILVSLWSASGYVGAFARMQNRIYDVAEGRPVWKLRPWLYLTTIVVFVFAIIAAMSLVVSGSIATEVFGHIGLGSQAATVWDWLKLPFIIIIVCFVISLLFWATPNVKRSFKEAMFNPGALVAFAVWAVGSGLFGWYVSNMGNYGKTYGPMATPVILLLWLWISNLAMLFGAEFDSEVLRTRQLKTGYPAEELILLPVRDEAEINKKAHKYDAQVEVAHELRLSSGVPNTAVAPMLPVAPTTRSNERVTAKQAGSVEQQPATPQARTVEGAPLVAASWKSKSPDLSGENANEEIGMQGNSTKGIAARQATAGATAVRPSDPEREEIVAERQGRLRKALAEARFKRQERDRVEREQAKVAAEQKKAEAEREKAEKKAEAERPLEEKWAETESVRARYDHANTREYRAVEAERAARRREWFAHHDA